MPTTSSNTRFSAVIIPILSKQHMSTGPANGILNSSVQNIAVTVFSCLHKQNGKNLPYFDIVTKLALTAKLSSIGSSGGMTLVMMSTQSNNSLLFF